MKGLLQKWSIYHLFAGGPEVGTQAKVYPEAIRFDGIQPGETGQRITAQEMNYVLSLLSEHVANTRYAGVQTHRTISTAQSQFATAVAWSNETGELWTTTLSSIARVAGGTLDQLDSAVANFSFSPEHAGVSRPGGVAFFGAYASGYRVRYTNGPVSAGSVSTADVAAGGAVGVHSAVYDPVGQQCVALTSDKKFLRFSDANSLSVVTPPALPALNDSTARGRQLLAVSSSGQILCCYASTASGVSSFTVVSSSDAGATWAIKTNALGTVATDLKSLAWVDDFLGLGGHFVIVTYAGSTGLRIQYSTTGDTWTAITPAAETGPLATPLSRAVILGDSIILGSPGSSAISAVYEIKTERVIRFTPGPFFTTDGAYLWFVGGRLVYRNQSNGNLYVSNPLTSPLDPLLRSIH